MPKLIAALVTFGASLLVFVIAARWVTRVASASIDDEETLILVSTEG